MTKRLTLCLMAILVAISACGPAGAQRTNTYDTSHYANEAPLSLGLNGTLFFTIDGDVATETILAGDPNFLPDYTRIGCGGSNPGDFFDGGMNPVARDAVNIRSVSIVQEAQRASLVGDIVTLHACVSFHADGKWSRGAGVNVEVPLAQTRATVTIPVAADNVDVIALYATGRIHSIAVDWTR